VNEKAIKYKYPHPPELNYKIVAATTNIIVVPTNDSMPPVN